jgi:hypothetical protein
MRGTDVLRSENERLRSLLARGGSGLPARGLLRDLQAGLRHHFRLGEEVLFPAVRRLRSRPARECVRRALAEHHQIEATLTRLEQSEPEEPGWGAELDVLRGRVREHLDREEAEVCGQAEAQLAVERLERLGALMQAYTRG